MARSNGKISKPVQYEDIQLALGTSANDIGQLCQSEFINRWSFKKPVRKNKWFEMTEDDFFSVDDGFVIPSYNSARDCAADVFNGNADWEYQRPRGLSYNEQFRTLDFNGYDHNAAPWFTLGFTGTTDIELGETIHFTLEKDLYWLVRNFSKWSFVINSSGVPISGKLDVGFLLKSSYNEIYYYKICDWIDFTDYDKMLNIVFPADESEGIPVGTYQVVPVLTTDTRHKSKAFYFPPTTETTTYTWYSIPSDPITVKLSKAGASALSKITISLVSYTVSEPDVNYNITVSSIKINISNSGSAVDLNLLNAKMVDARYSTSGIIFNDSYLVSAGSSTVELVSNSVTYESSTGNPTVNITMTLGSNTKSYSFQLFEK